MKTKWPEAAEILSDRNTINEYQESVRKDPIGWIYTALGVELWSKQEEIVEAVRDNSKVAVRSCNAVGKSFVASCLVPWFLETHAPGYVITTSSSWRGIKEILWPEIRTRLRSAPLNLGGEVLQTEWRRGDQWGAFGVSAEVPENFAGFRTQNGVLVIVDEASALGIDIMEAIMALMASGDSKVLLIGNPLRPSGPFYDAFRNPGWKTLSVSALESPNIILGKEVVPGLATLDWMKDRQQEWGEDTPAYQARVLGEFPTEGEDTLIKLSWVEDAMEREVWKDEGEEEEELFLGVDVARFGSDRTVFALRDNKTIKSIEHKTKISTMEIAGKVVSYIKDFSILPENVFIDDCGVGGGVVDRLRELKMKGIRAVNFASSSTDDRFTNLRAECYWYLRDALNPNGPTESILLSIPRKHRNLANECTLSKYAYASNGKIKLEGKDDIRKRLGRSPDLADALALTFAPRRSKPRAIWL